MRLSVESSTVLEQLANYSPAGTEPSESSIGFLDNVVFHVPGRFRVAE
jgi:hypothetical protein